MKIRLRPLLLLALASCQPDKTTATQATQPTPAGAPADTLAVADARGHRVGIVQLRPSTPAAFAKLPAGPLPAPATAKTN